MEVPQGVRKVPRSRQPPHPVGLDRRALALKLRRDARQPPHAVAGHQDAALGEGAFQAGGVGGDPSRKVEFGEAAAFALHANPNPVNTQLRYGVSPARARKVPGVKVERRHPSCAVDFWTPWTLTGASGLTAAEKC